MVLAVMFAWVVAGQQLQVTPFPAEVGQAVTVRAQRSDGAIADLALTVELPDGSRRAAGPTGSDGTLRFVPEAPGTYVFAADVDGVRIVAPHRVVPVRPRWLLALGCVPLALVILWRNLSPGRGRRDP